jgi:hypothetical protein
LIAPSIPRANTPTAAQSVADYVDPIKVRTCRDAAKEAILVYPLLNIRLVFDATNRYATARHRDAMGSVRTMPAFTTNAAGQGKRTVFRPRRVISTHCKPTSRYMRSLPIRKSVQISGIGLPCGRYRFGELKIALKCQNFC